MAVVPSCRTKRNQPESKHEVGELYTSGQNPPSPQALCVFGPTQEDKCLERCLSRHTRTRYVRSVWNYQVEAAQDASAPVVRRPNYLWWSASYHMQNPVENLEPGTRLVFTVKDQSTEVVPSGRRAVAGGGGVRELGWGMIHVNKSTMNSQVRAGICS